MESLENQHANEEAAQDDSLMSAEPSVKLTPEELADIQWGTDGGRNLD
jgi:hypothetical protein